MSPLSVPVCCRCLIAEIIDLISDSSQWANQMSHLISESDCKCTHPQWCCAQWHGEGAMREEEGRKSGGKKTAGGCVVLQWTWTCCIIQHLPKSDREARWDKTVLLNTFWIFCLSLCWWNSIPVIMYDAAKKTPGSQRRGFGTFKPFVSSQVLTPILYLRTDIIAVLSIQAVSVSLTHQISTLFNPWKLIKIYIIIFFSLSLFLPVQSAGARLECVLAPR